MSDQKENRRFRSSIYFLQGVFLTLFLLSIFLIVYFTILYNCRSSSIRNYAIVFDAGSSHTEMYVYHWPADKSNGLGNTSSVDELFLCPVGSIVVEENEQKIKLKAISDFENHLELLTEYFRPCLTEATKRIPVDRQKFSPIFLGATAGMRLVQLRNNQTSMKILEKIREIFSETPFEFVVARQIRILSGIEEAIDGWITTNLLLNKFRQKNENQPSMIAVLDLGGASTQITFTYDSKTLDEPIPDEFTSKLNLFNDDFQPFAHSYLCWGKNEAQKRYRARLINSLLNNKNFTTNNSKVFVKDPCLTRAANETLSVSNIFRSSCTINERKRFRTDLNISSFVFYGTGNVTKCQKRIVQLFDAKRNDRTVNCSYKSEYCTFDHSYQPKLPSNLDFIALSGYYYVFNNLAHGMTKTQRMPKERYDFKDFPREEFDQRLIEVCETNYSIFRQREGVTPNNEQHKKPLCFDGWYVWLLLTYGIGFTQTELQRLTFVHSFPSGKLGWTLGYMINQTNYIPTEHRHRLISKTTFIGSFTGSLVIAVLSFLFLFTTCYILLRRSKTITNNHELQVQT